MIPHATTLSSAEAKALSRLVGRTLDSLEFSPNGPNFSIPLWSGDLGLEVFLLELRVDAMNHGAEDVTRPGIVILGSEQHRARLEEITAAQRRCRAIMPLRLPLR